MMIGRFRLRLWPTLGMLLGLSMLLTLGTWQWMRYSAKIVEEEQQESKIDMPTVEVKALSDFDAADVDYRRIEATGTLDLDRVFLIKHRIFQEKPGFWIVTPLRLEGDGGAILVNHGWIPYRTGEDVALAFMDRNDHPGTFQGLVHVLEYVVADSAARERFTAGARPTEEPLTYLETYDVTAIADLLPYDVTPRQVVFTLDPIHTGSPYPIASYEHITEPYLTAEKHLGYSITWFTLALALIAMYIFHGLGLLGSRAMAPRPPSLV